MFFCHVDTKKCIISVLKRHEDAISMATEFGRNSFEEQTEVMTSVLKCVLYDICFHLYEREKKVPHSPEPFQG